MKEIASVEKYKKKRYLTNGTKEFLLLISIILILLPFLWAIVLSFKNNSEILSGTLSFPEVIRWENYEKAWETIDFFVLVKNTLIISVVAISISIAINILSSYAISRMDFGTGKLQKIFYVYFIIGLLVPVFVLIYPVFVMNSAIGTIDSLWAVILPYIGWSAPMNTLLLVGAFKTIPKSLEEAAVIDGCSPWKILWKVDMPIVRSAIITAITIQFLGTWNEFAVSVVMLTSPEVQTISLAASKFVGIHNTDFGAMAAAVVILSIPQVIAFTYFQKFIVADMTAGSVKG